MESDNFEEVLLNIETFCRVLADKISGVKRSSVEPEPIEKLLRRKVEVEFHGDVEGREPLIDIFEDERQVKILMLVKPLPRSKITMGVNGDFTEISVGGNLKIRFPIRAIDANRIHVNNNDWTLEITIEKELHAPNILPLIDRKNLVSI